MRRVGPGMASETELAGCLGRLCVLTLQNVAGIGDRCSSWGSVCQTWAHKIAQRWNDVPSPLSGFWTKYPELAP